MGNCIPESYDHTVSYADDKVIVLLDSKKTNKQLYFCCNKNDLKSLFINVCFLEVRKNKLSETNHSLRIIDSIIPFKKQCIYGKIGRNFKEVKSKRIDLELCMADIVRYKKEKDSNDIEPILVDD